MENSPTPSSPQLPHRRFLSDPGTLPYAAEALPGQQLPSQRATAAPSPPSQADAAAGTQSPSGRGTPLSPGLGTAVPSTPRTGTGRSSEARSPAGGLGLWPSQLRASRQLAASNCFVISRRAGRRSLQPGNPSPAVCWQLCARPGRSPGLTRPRPPADPTDTRAGLVPGHSITESQNSRGWQGPLWVTQSNPPAQAGSPRAGCTGPCPGGS